MLPALFAIALCQESIASDLKQAEFPLKSR